MYINVVCADILLVSIFDHLVGIMQYSCFPIYFYSLKILRL